jgi:hypothetical protein
MNEQRISFENVCFARSRVLEIMVMRKNRLEQFFSEQVQFAFNEPEDLENIVTLSTIVLNSQKRDKEKPYWLITSRRAKANTVLLSHSKTIDSIPEDYCNDIVCHYVSSTIS